MHLVPFALTFAFASLIPVAAPQQPMEASLAIGYRQGKIDFKLAAVAVDGGGMRASATGASEPLEPGADATGGQMSRPWQQKPAFDSGVQVADGATGGKQDATVAVADVDAPIARCGVKNSLVDTLARSAAHSPAATWRSSAART